MPLRRLAHGRPRWESREHVPQALLEGALLGKKKSKARLPARPIPLNMYNVSVVKCQCGFRGEAPVGKLMEVVCGTCWRSVKELTGVWTEDGAEIKTFCEPCGSYQRGFAKVPKKHAPQNTADMEYSCESCFRVRPLSSEELLRNQGLAYCSLCGWVGYPEIRERERPPQEGGRAKGRIAGGKNPPRPTVNEDANAPKSRLMKKPAVLAWGGSGGGASSGSSCAVDSPPFL